MRLGSKGLIGRQKRDIMVKMTRWNPWIGGLLVATTALVGCAPKTDVSTTANVPAAYSHAYMSVKEIWFNTDASATPDDTTWKKFPLTTPVTVDLAASLDGTLTSLTTGLNVPAATYAQARLIPVDPSEPLLSSASNLLAIFNSEVDYTDSRGNPHRLPMEFLNPDKGLGVTATIQVKANTNTAFSSAGGTATSTTDVSTSTQDSPLVDISTTDNSTTNSATNSTNTTPTSNSTTDTSGTTVASFKLAINVDGSKDLVPFTYSNQAGIMLNPHFVAYDQSAVGAIAGTLDVSGLTGLTSASTSGFLNVQVTAESLSADGTRHVAINSAPVRSDGTFTLYPLSTTSSSPTSYDLVIHGPGIATIIVKGVTVNVGDTSSPVSIGTLTPAAASTFLVNLNATNPLQAGALVGFYQTLSGSGEVPYLIDSQPIDPFTRMFNANVPESLGPLYSGTFSSSGADIGPKAAIPSEGAGTYRVAGTAPLFSDGPLTTMVTGSAGATNVLAVAVPQLSAASGATLDTTSFTISNSSANFNKGELIISHDGAIVQTAALDSVLSRSGNGILTISGLPGGSSSGTFDDGVYYVSVRVWNTSNPATTLNREIYPTALDLRKGGSSGYQLTIQ